MFFIEIYRIVKIGLIFMACCMDGCLGIVNGCLTCIRSRWQTWMGFNSTHTNLFSHSL